MSPIEIHPEAPVFPISWPRKFSASLAEKIGPYKTRGWAADTAALKERKISEEAFMEDLREIFEKRRDMAFQVLEHDKPNLFIEVFSGDRPRSAHVLAFYRQDPSTLQRGR